MHGANALTFAPSPTLPRTLMLPYALSIFTGAFLLFQVQPLIGKYILPWFGGGPGVWTTCLLFFQSLLLGGYAYAHFSSTRLKPRQQAGLHLVLLVISLALLPITPSDSWKENVAGEPNLRILILLTVTIGLPYFVLSSTGPLMQQWFSRTNPGVSPYRLYALSNVGSLLALLSYPAYFEVKFSRQTQATLWSAGLVLFVLFCGFCAYRVWWHFSAESVAAREAAERAAAERAAVALEEERRREAALQPMTEETDPLLTVMPGIPPPPAPPPAEVVAAPVPTPVPAPAPAAEATAVAVEAPGQTTPVDKLLWVALPMIASVLLLATTNKLSQEVAVIPFLWVLPLSLYLLTFIICFDHARWYHRGTFTALLVCGMAAVPTLIAAGNDAPMRVQIVGYTATLFVACMVCHGELYRLKPPPERLTAYFLMISAGGALGGFFVAIVAPAIFSEYRELQIGLWVLSYGLGILCWRHASRELALGAAAGAILLTVSLPWLRSYLDDSSGFVSEVKAIFTENQNRLYVAIGLVLTIACLFDFRRLRISEKWQPRMAAFIMILCIALGMVFLRQARSKGGVEVLSATRNFYGTLKVYNYYPTDEQDNYHLLLHGATTHGIQFVNPQKAMMPTTYYGDASGVGLAMNNLPESPRRIGLVGLGTGSLVAYLRADDYMRIYEINPAVETLAREQFKYLAYTQAKVDVVMGDARLVMEQEVAAKNTQKFDLLALDAFSSDAIPVHLLTKEAFELYLQQIKPDGVIAVHISNRYLDLRPVVEKVAAHHNLHTVTISEDSEPNWWIYSTTWMLVSRNKAFLEIDSIKDVAEAPETHKKEIPLWTDDYASLYSIMK